MPLKEYIKYQVMVFGWKHLLSRKVTKYTRILARGYCDHNRKEIVLWRQAPQHVLLHELGHEVGLKHSTDKNNIMYPTGNRGREGIFKIHKRYSIKYGDYYHVKMIEDMHKRGYKI